MTSEDCGMKTSRAVLFLLNLVFVLIGLTLIGIGLWVRLEPSTYNLLVTITTAMTDNLPKIASYIFIATGGFIVIVGIIGCIGTARKSPALLGMYICFVMLAILAEIAAGVLAMIFLQQLNGATSNIFMEQLTANNIHPYLNGNHTFGQLMNWCQKQYQCCGFNGPEDYNLISTFDETYPVPPTCCKSFSGDASKANYSMVANWTLCLDEANSYLLSANFTPAYMWTNGCQNQIEYWISSTAAIFIGIALGSAGIEMFLIIYAFCLCMISRAEGG